MRTAAVIGWTCGCAALLAAAPSVGAADRAMFKSDTRVVALASTVTDGDQRMVLNLTKDDFEVLDDSRPQPLTFFDAAALPIRVVVMLDTSGSMSQSVARLRAAARAFVARLLPDDACRVGAFHDEVRLGADFTSDRGALDADLDALDTGDATRLYDALGASLDALASADGRRVILVFTDGADTDSTTSYRSIVSRARAAGVMVYAVGVDRPRAAHASRVDEGLKKLAAETGGGYFALAATADVAATFAGIADELHSQYVLGFSPDRLDGRVHTVTVRVKRAGLLARGRRSYVAAADSVR